MPRESDKGCCFIISPIGDEGSDTRTRSDQILKHITGPAARECGYHPIRADQISEPGLITSQVIQHVIEDPLVIADLTGRNPNVFYELALRHAIKKPVVQIIHATESIPFDIAATRTVHVDHHDLDSAATAREEIVRQIQAVEKAPQEVDTPISVAIELQSLRQSENPLEKSNAEIISMLQELRVAIADIREQPRGPRIHPGVIEELVITLERIRHIVGDGDEIDPEAIEHIRNTLSHSERMLEMLVMESGMNPRILHRFRHRSRE